MKLIIGADHAGAALGIRLEHWLSKSGHDVTRLGPDSDEPKVNYVPICIEAAERVASGEFERGIVIGGSGQGEQIAANKVRGVRAALCNSVYLARLAALYNDANVLGLGARIVAPELAEDIVHEWLTSDFVGGRHEDRLSSISEYELERDQL